MEHTDFIFFDGHRKDERGLTALCLSQFYGCEFRIEGVRYCCAEQFMMASKARTFRDAVREKRILASRDPRKIKEFGRQVRPFDAEMWETVAYNVVARGNYYKFIQNDELKNFLLATGDKTLAEASRTDAVWGIGLSATAEGIEDEKNWRGQNLLGKALMEVRAAIRDNVPETRFLREHPIMNRRITEWVRNHRGDEAECRVNDPANDPEVVTGTRVREVKSLAERALKRRLEMVSENPGAPIRDDETSPDERKLLAEFDKAYRGHVYRNLLRDPKHGGRYSFTKKCSKIGGVEVCEPVRGSLRGSDVFAAVWAKLMGIRYISPLETNASRTRRQNAARRKGQVARPSVLKPAIINFDFTEENVGRGAFRKYLDNLTWCVYCEMCGSDAVRVKEKDIYGNEIVNYKNGKATYRWVPKYATGESDFAMQKKISHALSKANDDKRREARCKLVLETSVLSYYLTAAKGLKCPEWFKPAIKWIFEDGRPVDEVKARLLDDGEAPSSSSFDKELSLFRKGVRERGKALLEKAFAYDVIKVPDEDAEWKSGLRVKMLDPKEVLDLAWEELALWVGDKRMHDIRYNIIRAMVDRVGKSE